MLCTMIEPTDGDVLIDGFRLGRDNEEIKRNIGVVYQDNCLDEILTVKENVPVLQTLLPEAIVTSYEREVSDETLQKNSIIVHDNNYIQNSGVDYGKDTEFEVISILEGTVISVKEDDTLNGTVEVKHDNGYVSVYQSLKDIKVKKDQVISQGQTIGTATTNELDKELGNHLHFELIVSGQKVNPEIYLDKELS